jgi:hypothetical protein
MLPPSLRFPPLREGNHVGVRFPRFARGTMWGFGSRAWRGEPERLGSPCGQGEPAGGGSKNSARHAPRLTVRALCTEVRASCTADRAPRLRVRARRTADRAPRLTVRARWTAVHRRRFCPVGLHGMSPHRFQGNVRVLMAQAASKQGAEIAPVPICSPELGQEASALTRYNTPRHVRVAENL